MVRLDVSLECQTTTAEAVFNQSSLKLYEMTINAKTLIDGLVAMGTNIQGEPLVSIKSNPSLGKFIVRQNLKLNLGVPTTETTLHDESGTKVYTAKDQDNHGWCKSCMIELEYDCRNRAMELAKVKTNTIVDIFGYLD